MSVFASLFGSVVAARNRAYDRGWLRAGRLNHSVVSVGNLSVGGSGKTPFLLMLGQLLQQRGVAFDILSRGYGRRDGKIRLVEENGSAELYGDEPLVLAQKLHVPVIVGPDRYKAGLFAEKLFSEAKPAHGLWLHLLDDGLQHRRLTRDFEIVMVRPEDATDSLLPDGQLREPLIALRRADAVVLTEGATTLGLNLDKQHVWRAKRYIELDPVRGSLTPRPFVICSIARPERFLYDLRVNEIEPVGQALFADHHLFSEADMRVVCDQARAVKADGFLITEKDAVRLAPFLTMLEKVGPVTAVPLVMELVDPQHALDVLLGTVAERLRCREA